MIIILSLEFTLETLDLINLFPPQTLHTYIPSQEKKPSVLEKLLAAVLL